MNDRFKYRVYNKRTEEMLDVRLISYFSTGNICRVEAQNAVGDIKIFDDYKTSIEDIELMQCTGLKDKNGKLIFEGDIIQIPDDYDTYGMFACEKREIYFNEGGFRLKPKWDKNSRGNWLEDTEDFEIIGNIYENKELLNNE